MLEWLKSLFAPLPPRRINAHGETNEYLAQAALSSSGRGRSDDASGPVGAIKADIGVNAPSVSSLVVTLSYDPAGMGSMALIDAYGTMIGDPIAVYSNAAVDAAARFGNPDRDPLLPFGQTPTGQYALDRRLPARADAIGIQEFGSRPVIRFLPLSGECARAEARGRLSLLIVSTDGDLRQDTNGSLRISGPDMDRLLSAIPPDAAVRGVRMTISRPLAVHDASPSLLIDGYRVTAGGSRNSSVAHPAMPRSAPSGWDSASSSGDDWLLWYLLYEQMSDSHPSPDCSVPYEYPEIDVNDPANRPDCDLSAGNQDGTPGDGADPFADQDTGSALSALPDDGAMPTGNDADPFAGPGGDVSADAGWTPSGTTY